ncbi:MAG: hypothetical protein R3296_14620 [Oleiphilaceae bacterium]|nr:hypothetical protein [Oleiphilaceae bacterium]
MENMLSNKERYEYMAYQIEREDGLVDTRIRWMLTFEGFLLAALALASDGGDPLIQEFLKYAIPVIGIIVALLSYAAIEAALSTLNRLKKMWDDETYQGYPRPFGKMRASAFGALFARGLPLVICALWGIMLGTFILSGLY